MVETGIGTGTAFENYYLHLDTGSSLSWIQCEPCHECFQQQPRLFNPQNSPSYGTLTANHPYCRAPFYKPGPNGLCYFSIFYADDTSANGTLSSEVFTFTASQGAYVHVPNVVFGCTHQTDTDYPLNGPVGIFGLNLEPESFISQPSSSPVTGMRFSYCLVEPGSTAAMTMLFGDDITWPPVARIQETQILRFNNGAHYTYLPKLAYKIVRDALVLHFETRHLLPVQGRGEAERFDLCFDLPPNEDPVNLLPGMTFHFAGADVPLFYQQVFYVDLHEQQFCLAMFPENTGLAPAVLGAFQQVNTQFEFDMRTGGILRMATVDCTHGV
ncbi:hypothetical protein LUZ63_008852 [Rhynchospora breviuscula]|uniref:Peptidase A1 domain-containing protein n=1 Tax=Rhynchospora breviuscula TaxID=2022672 RepID=A0A9Q0CDX5_9POAL|nr:hypothetical protein LUZ63_008852 [Rhynchospora breviuscula]